MDYIIGGALMREYTSYRDQGYPATTLHEAEEILARWCESVSYVKGDVLGIVKIVFPQKNPSVKFLSYDEYNEDGIDIGNKDRNSVRI